MDSSNAEQCQVTTFDNDGNIIVGGYFLGVPFDFFDAGSSSASASVTSMAGTYVAFIAKYSPQGKLLWKFHMDPGSSRTVEINGIQTDNGNDIFIVGEVTTYAGLAIYDTSGVLSRTVVYTSCGSYCGFIFRVSPSGAVRWFIRTFTLVNGLALDSSGTIMTTGMCMGSCPILTTSDTNAGVTMSGTNEFGFVLRLNSSGVYVSHSIMDAGGRDESFAVASHSTGAFAVTGRCCAWNPGMTVFNSANTAVASFSDGTDYAGFITTFQPNGAFNWVARWDTSQSSTIAYVKSIKYDNVGNVIAGGIARGITIYDSSGKTSVTAPTASYDRPILTKFNTTGGIEWLVYWDVASFTTNLFSQSLDIDSAGNIYFSGSYKGTTTARIVHSNGNTYNIPLTASTSTEHGFVVKFSPDGTVLDLITVRNTYQAVVLSVAVHSNSSRVILAGFTNWNQVGVYNRSNNMIESASFSNNGAFLASLNGLSQGTSTAPSSAPFICPLNSQCDASTSSFACLAGFAFNSTSNGCSSCPLGQFKLSSGNTNCTACPVGQESTVNRTSCSTCTNRKYRSLTTLVQCIDCPSNSECTPSSFTCNIGYRVNAQNNGCDQCPIGTESSANRANCVACSAGFYRPNLFNNSCINCPTNAECTPSSFTCNIGYRINSVSNGCDQCPIGTESSANRANCVACSTGFYRPSLSNNSCINCPINAVCSNTSFVCNAGYRINSIGSGCDQCLVGTESNANRTACISCKVGFYRPYSVYSNCIKCPDNSNCTSTSFTCLPGFQLNSNGTSCISCPIGFVKPTDGNGTCTRCDIGQEPNSNKTVCIDCSSGYFKPTIDYLVCADCPEGARCSPKNLTCLAGYTPNLNQSYSCIYCPENYFKPNEGNFGCDKCSVGLYSSDDYTTCFSCPSGFFINSNNTCSRCGTGRQPVFNRTYCIDCPPETYKPDDSYNLCLRCPTGATCTTTSFTCKSGFEISSNRNGCRRCLHGYYKQNPGNTDVCVQCPIGFQSSDDRSSCEPCINSYRPSLNIAFCQSCPLNSQCSKGEFTCLEGYTLQNGECISNIDYDNTNGNSMINHVVSSTIMALVSQSPESSAQNTWANIFSLPIFYAFFIPLFVFAICGTYAVIRYLNWRSKETARFGITKLNGTNTSQLAINSVISQLLTTQEYHDEPTA